MPGYKKPMMYGKKPMMAKKGLAALAAKVPELTYTPKMMKVMGNKGTKNSPLNFKDLDIANAKAMDYNQGKPMMYGKPKMTSEEDPKIATEKIETVDLGTVKKKNTNFVKNPYYKMSDARRNRLRNKSGRPLPVSATRSTTISTSDLAKNKKLYS